MECTAIKKLIEKNSEGDELFTHINTCPVCRTKYLSDEPHAILKAIAVPENEEEFWEQQRRNIVTGIKKELHKKVIKWLTYAAAVLVPLVVAVFISSKITITPVPHVPGHEAVKIPAVVEIRKEEVTYPVIDEIKNPGARYYQIPLDTKTQLVMIVDAKMDI